MARKLEKLASLRAEGAALGEEMNRWLEGLPTRTRGQLVRWGLIDGRSVASAKPLREHLTDYNQALLDGVASRKQKGPATQKHADLAKYRVTTLLDGIGAKVLSDVSVESVGRYLAERRAKGLSVVSSNHYVKDCKAFFNRLVRSGRVSANPIASVAKMQVTAKARKYIRRALEADEAAKLLQETRTGPEWHGMGGVERYWLYRLAMETGLRSSELRALTRASFRLDDTEPMVWLPGDATKNREPAELPLRSETVAELRTFLAGKHPGASVFPNMPVVTDVAYMLRFDLKAAGIEYETDSGRVDFHALRVTCLSWLADAGTPLRTLQEFARHSTPTLTMNIYARTLRDSMSGAAARLPDLNRPAREPMKATGTYANGAEATHFGTAETTPKSTPTGARSPALPCVMAHDSRTASHVMTPASLSGKNRENLAHQGALQRTGVDGNRTHQGPR
ncbi:MAG: tyrosine-type recombinase/integrase [Planctomycetota bacterium]